MFKPSRVLSRPLAGLTAALLSLAEGVPLTSFSAGGAKRSRTIHHTPPSAALREEIRQHNARVEADRKDKMRWREGRQWDRLMGYKSATFLNKSARRRMVG